MCKQFVNPDEYRPIINKIFNLRDLWKMWNDLKGKKTGITVAGGAGGAAGGSSKFGVYNAMTEV